MKLTIWIIKLALTLLTVISFFIVQASERSSRTKVLSEFKRKINSERKTKENPWLFFIGSWYVEKFELPADILTVEEIDQNNKSIKMNKIKKSLINKFSKWFKINDGVNMANIVVITLQDMNLYRTYKEALSFKETYISDENIKRWQALFRLLFENNSPGERFIELRDPIKYKDHVTFIYFNEKFPIEENNYSCKTNEKTTYRELNREKIPDTVILNRGCLIYLKAGGEEFFLAPYEFYGPDRMKYFKNILNDKLGTKNFNSVNYQIIYGNLNFPILPLPESEDNKKANRRFEKRRFYENFLS